MQSHESSTASVHGTWPNRWTFILAATGSAVGLGNIWKFPYITGENGGGAFVLVYLVCIALVGIPIMIAETLLGRRGRANPINAIETIAVSSARNPRWKWVGGMGVVTGLLIMSFYSVIAGWALRYVVVAAGGQFEGADSGTVGDIFGDLLANPSTLVGWHTAFTLMTFAVVAAGVTKGLGSVARYMMPFLFIALIILTGYGIIAGDIVSAITFLFKFDLSHLTTDAVLVALGHAFFTLSLGMGAIMAYGAYMPQQACLGKTVLMVGVLDTIIGLVAGLAIFPIVFATAGIEPGAGPGLLFVSLPVAFGNMPLGLIFGVLFFVLVSVAAWSSAVSLIEPAVAWLIENHHWSRTKATGTTVVFTWALGLLTVLSFNHLESFKPPWLLDFTFFEFLDFLTAQIMLPLGGLLIAIFVGWQMKPADIHDETASFSVTARRFWLVVLRYVSPTLVAVIMVLKLYETLFSAAG